MSAALELIQTVSVERPADIVFRQLRGLIVDGKLKADERLPSERQLAERFGLNRIHVREALQRLEFFGLIKLQRNVGAVVTSSGIRAVEGIFSNLLALSDFEQGALFEARHVIETQVAALAAERASDAELVELQELHDQFAAEVARGESGLQSDMAFHLRVADAARSPVLRVLVGLLAADVMVLARERRACEGGRAAEAVAEHRAVLRALQARQPAKAAAAMGRHVVYNTKGC